MFRHIPVLLLMISLLCCRKEAGTCYKTNPLSELEWLKQKQQQLSSCVCLMQIIEARFEGKTVFEVRLVDPACDGLNMVYSCDGSVLFNSADPSTYHSYVQNSSLKKIWWSCTK